MFKKKRKTPLDGGENIVTPLTKKLKSVDNFIQLAIIKEIDVSFDIAELVILKEDKTIKLPFDTSLGLQKDDTVILMKTEGYYHIIAKALLHHPEENIYIYDPTESDPDKLVKAKKTPSPLPIDYMKKYFVIKEEGDILRYIKQTGYKISETFMHLFSKTSRIIIDNTKLIFTSKSYEKFFYKNPSYSMNVETDKSEVLKYKLLYNKKSIPYMFKAEGELSALNNSFNIEFVNLDIDLSKVVDIKIVFKALTKDDLSKVFLKGSVTHKYNFEKRSLEFLSSKNTASISVWDPITKKNSNYKLNSVDDELYNAKVKKEINNAKSIFDKNFHVFVNIEDKYYENKYDGLYVTYLKLITDSGEVIEFSKSFTQLSDKTETVAKTNKVITDDYKLVWQQKYQNINIPYKDSSYYLHSNYSKFIHKEYSKGVSYNYNPYINYQTMYQINIDKLKTKLYRNTLTITGLGIDKNLNYENITLKEKNKSLKPFWRMSLNYKDNNINVYYNPNTLYSVTGKVNNNDMRFILNNNMIYGQGFKNFYLKDIKYINAEDAFMTLDSLQLNKLYVKDTLNVQAQNIFFKTKNYFIDTNNFQVKMKNGILYSTDNLTMYSTIKTNDNSRPQYSAIMMSNKNVSIGASNNVNVQGYCKCTSQ